MPTYPQHLDHDGDDAVEVVPEVVADRSLEHVADRGRRAVERLFPRVVMAVEDGALVAELVVQFLLAGVVPRVLGLLKRRGGARLGVDGEREPVAEGPRRTVVRVPGGIGGRHGGGDQRLDRRDGAAVLDEDRPRGLVHLACAAQLGVRVADDLADLIDRFALLSVLALDEVAQHLRALDHLTTDRLDAVPARRDRAAIAVERRDAASPAAILP
ncbi:MAG: hypothetical protein PGN24_08135 [Microbacterium arborescens]